MGEYADDAWDPMDRDSWHDALYRRPYTPRIPTLAAKAEDFPLLDQPKPEPSFDDLLYELEDALVEYREYACTESAARLDNAREALKARLK